MQSIRSLFPLALALVVSFGCKGSASAPPSADAGPPPPAEVTFPTGFLWGASTAAFQVEKGDSHPDWAHWVAMPGKIQNGDTPDNGGPDALAHIDEDIALMKSEGHT